MDCIKKANIEFEKASSKWIDLNYGALAIAFHRYWGWGKKRISRVINATYDAWDECGDNSDVCMLQMLEDETGIEIRNHENGKSYHEYAFFNPKVGNYKKGKMNKAQLIVMRQHQTQWLRQQILGCILLGLHRKYGFGTVRLSRLVNQIGDVIDEFDSDPKRLLDAAYDEVKFVMLEGNKNNGRTTTRNN